MNTVDDIVNTYSRHQSRAAKATRGRGPSDAQYGLGWGWRRVQAYEDPTPVEQAAQEQMLDQRRTMDIINAVATGMAGPVVGSGVENMPTPPDTYGEIARDYAYRIVSPGARFVNRRLIRPMTGAVRRRYNSAKRRLLYTPEENAAIREKRRDQLMRLGVEKFTQAGRQNMIRRKREEAKAARRRLEMETGRNAFSSRGPMPEPRHLSVH